MTYLCPLNIVFILANSAVPDEMLHYVAYQLGLHFLQVSNIKSVKKNGILNFRTFE